jgi:CO/xanthine dehydrogenase FAD-binding subunit
VSEPSLAAPRSLEELAALLGAATERTRFVAGATDLALRLRIAPQRPDRLIDLSPIPELRGISLEAGRIRIGAMVTFAELASNACVQQRASCLAVAARRVGSVQVRGMATLGGNVANASACADGVTPLLALGADAGVLTAGGVVARRSVATLFAPAGGSSLVAGEAIVDFGFQALEARDCSGFAKLGVRTSIAVSRLNAAAALTLGPDGSTCVAARLAFGSLGPSARLAGEVAAGLVGRRLDDEASAILTHNSVEYVDQAIGERPSRTYKRRAMRGLIADLWSDLLRSARGSA